MVAMMVASTISTELLMDFIIDPLLLLTLMRADFIERMSARTAQLMKFSPLLIAVDVGPTLVSSSILLLVVVLRLYRNVCRDDILCVRYR